MSKTSLLCTIIFSLCFAWSTRAVDTRNTRLMNSPAISKNHIAFIYAEDLWVAAQDGSHPVRLTSSSGVESNPFISPDGKTVAFTGQYDGNQDVYAVPIQGGVPKRLTFHSSPDIVRGFTPDGQILFSSTRAASNWRFEHLFTIGLNGGFPKQLPLPCGTSAAYSPDRKVLAYSPLGPRHLQWKNYRGGTHSRIWLYQTKTHQVQQVPQPKGRCNDTHPMWLMGRLFFLSDRDGESNLYAYDPKTKTVQAYTRHQDFPVLSASAGAGLVVYEQAGYLHLFDPTRKTTNRLNIGIATELNETRSRFVGGADHIRNMSISPSGARAVFEMRGEIVTVPAKKGTYRNLSQTTMAHERSPIWSPDGKSIAYFSDKSGEYQLVVSSVHENSTPKTYQLKGHGFYRNPAWSPDSQKISYIDNSHSLYFIQLGKAKVTKIAQEPEYSPLRTMTHSWSPDSKWIAYTLEENGLIQTVYLYSLDRQKSYRVSDPLSDVAEPVFDASGNYLYFFSSVDAGPRKDWFAQSKADMEVNRYLYAAVLKKGHPSPLAAESDEEKGLTKKNRKNKQRKNKKKAVKTIQIDVEGLARRVVALPVPASFYQSLSSDESGELYYLEQLREALPANQQPKYSLHKFSFKERKAETIIDRLDEYRLSADKKHLLVRLDKKVSITTLDNGENALYKNHLLARLDKKVFFKTLYNSENTFELALSQIRLRMDPKTEWPQIYSEVWRLNRDYFYATNFHGIDWLAMRKKYEVFLPHLTCRADLNRVIQWLCSELAVGHHRGGGGETLKRPEPVDVGLLGADYVLSHGRYRINRVYGGLHWNPELKSPLTEPGVNVKAGDYLLAVNGRELKTSTNIYSLFENTAERLTELTVGPKPSFKGSRVVKVTPVANELNLRHFDWLEGNLKKVDQATDGKVAYVYLPDTTVLGHSYFKRYFYSQVHKQAIIIDERFNRGGQRADYYIDILKRNFDSYWATRYGRDVMAPKAAIFGPKVMIIDETAGSGGDLLPWMFRKAKLGKIIGRPTWGGLVGILGYPPLMDGGFITAPNLAIWTKAGWIIENVGVPPDIEVEQLPELTIQGRDPQLEKAIQVVIEELKKNPPKKLKRPAYPVRNQ